MAATLRALRALFPVLRLKPWVLGAMIILGVLAALSEGLSISLFIPLVQNQMVADHAFPRRSTGTPAPVDRCQYFAFYGAEKRTDLRLFGALPID
jgi:hypothetical protein